MIKNEPTEKAKKKQGTWEREKKNKVKKPNKCYMEVEVPTTANISEHMFDDS